MQSHRLGKISSVAKKTVTYKSWVVERFSGKFFDIITEQEGNAILILTRPALHGPDGIDFSRRKW